MTDTVFDELKSYVDFSSADELALRALRPTMAPHAGPISDLFYRRILEHEGARRALEGGESQVGHLKVMLRTWMEELFSGPWDSAYYEKRSRIGRVHVRIQLPQHYMFGAMNVLREAFNDVVDTHYLNHPESLAAARRALGKILDLELAIMLHTYREDLLSQAARHERLSAFGQLVGSIGHELRNPLGVMETSLFILKGRPGVEDDPRTSKHLGRIGEQVEIANRIVSDLLDMIRDRPLQRQSVQLSEVWESAVGTLTPVAGIQLKTTGLESLPAVKADAGQLRQVFTNLLENAYQALGTEGWVQVSAASVPGVVELVLEDSGQGVDAAIRHRLFEPLITTKAKGVGLGLALVKRILEKHGGTVRYEPRPDSGARFVLRLPIDPP